MQKPDVNTSLQKDTGWRDALNRDYFLIKMGAGIILLLGLLSFLPFFFEHIEMRSGKILHDRLLSLLPAVDVSTPIFILIWGTGLLFIYRCISNPDMVLPALYGFIFVVASRILTIWIFPLDPPAGLVPMVDPLSNLAYGKVDFITKDLFYSGHCASLLLMFLCFKNRKDKAFSLTATIIVSILLLFQHVHYSMDVIAAPFFTYGCFLLSRRIVKT